MPGNLPLMEGLLMAGLMIPLVPLAIMIRVFSQILNSYSDRMRAGLMSRKLPVVEVMQMIVWIHLASVNQDQQQGQPDPS